MGSWTGLIGSVIVVIAALAQCTAAVTNHTVGDSNGWGVRSYDSWLSGKTFVVGDNLIFNFNAQFHDVVQVPKADYDSCTNATNLYTSYTSPTVIPLNTTGARYYICTFPGHCGGGQKLFVNIVSSTTEAPSSSPPPTAGSPPPSPSSSPPPTAGSPTPSPSSSPPPTAGSPPPSPSSAPSRAAAFGVAGAFMAVLTAFFL